MRNKAFITCILILLLVSIGCSSLSTGNNIPDGIHSLEGSPIQYQIEMPQNFQMAVDIQSVYYPKEVRRYARETAESSEQSIKDMLSKQNSAGVYRINIQNRAILVRDTNSKTYSRLINLSRTTPGVGTQTNAFNGAINNEDYRMWADLEGLPPLEGVLKKLDELMISSKLEGFVAIEAYALDAATLKTHDLILAQYRNSHLAEGVTPYLPYDWTEDDSCYLIIYNYQVDGIPVFYQKNLSYGKEIIPLTYAYAFYGKEGLICLEAYGLYGTMHEESFAIPISVTEILNVFLSEIKTTIQVEGTELFSIELCYLPEISKEGVHLIPIWTFEVSYPNSEAGKVGQDLYNRSVYIYDAISGEKYDVR